MVRPPADFCTEVGIQLQLLARYIFMMQILFVVLRINKEHKGINYLKSSATYGQL